LYYGSVDICNLRKIVSYYNNISPGNLLNSSTFLGTMNKSIIKGEEMDVRNIQ